MKVNDEIIEEIRATIYSEGFKYLITEYKEYLDTIKEQLSSLTSPRDTDLINKGQVHAILTLMAMVDKYKK